MPPLLAVPGGTSFWRASARFAREHRGLGPGRACAPSRTSFTASSNRASREAERREALGGVRRVMMAQRMRKAKAVAAHTLVVEELEMSALIALRAALKTERRERGIALTLLPFFIRALGLVLPLHPFLNASLDEAAGELVFHDAVNVGVAVDAEMGLVVPVIHDAGTRTIWDIATTLRRLTVQTRTGVLAKSDGSGGTFTLEYSPGLWAAFSRLRS